MTPDEIRAQSLAEALKNLMTQKRWSVDKLAESAEVSPSSIKNWRSGDSLTIRNLKDALEIAARITDDEDCASAFLKIAGHRDPINHLRKRLSEESGELEVINRHWPEKISQASILRRQQPAGPIKNHPQPESTPAENTDQQLLQTYLNYLVREKFNPVFLNPRLDPNKKRHSIKDIFVELTVTDQRIPTDEGYDKYKAELDKIAWGWGDDATQTIEQIGQQDNVFLLRGLPGSGKTTLLKHVGHAFASDLDEARESREKFGWEKEGARLIPIYVKLSRLNEWLKTKGYPKQDDVMVDYLETSYCLDHKSEYTKVYKAEHDRYAGAKKMSHLLVDFLFEGRCIVMFDGLDEVIGQNERNKVTDVLISFIKRFGFDKNRNYILMASRPNGLESSAHRLTGVDVVICQVMPLSEEKRNQLIFALLKQLNIAALALAEQKRKQLIQNIDKDRDLAQIATNPLSCTALTLIYDQSGDLPKNRVGLLTQLIDQQLELDETKSDSDQFSFIEGSPFRDDYEAYGPSRRSGINVRKGLRRLAFLTFSHGGDGLQPMIAVKNIEATLKNDLDYSGDKADMYALDFLKVMAERKGLFILFHADHEKPNEDIYNFVHRQFMECLAAEHLIFSLGIKKSLDQLRTNAGEAAWDEVIKLYLSNPELKRPERDNAVQALIATQHPHTTALAAEGLVELGVTLNEPKDFISPELLMNEIGWPNLKDELYQEMIDMERTPRDRFRSGRVLDALGWLPPDLHDWVRCEGIAEGEGENDLWVMKYPLTNIQYEPFVLLNGYAEAESWSKGRVKRIEPLYWHSDRLGRDRQGFPVVGVDWSEADEYCAWLTNQLNAYRPHAAREAVEADWRDCLTAPNRGVPLSSIEIDRVIKTLKALLNRFLESVGEGEALVIRLPSETEWVKIAGGKEGDRYPWDLKGDSTPHDSEEGVAEILGRANVDAGYDIRIGNTSPVGMFPTGARVVPDGKIMDMAGNVWEWSSSSYVDKDGGKDDRYRYNRGGGWFDSPASARVAVRFDDHGLDDPYDGFRCVCGSRSSISSSY